MKLHNATTVTDIGCSKLKTCAYKYIWILRMSIELENVLIYPAGVALNQYHKRNKSYLKNADLLKLQPKI